MDQNSHKERFDRFAKSIRSHDYKQSHVDQTLFYNHSSDGKLVILRMRIDDIILTRDNLAELERLNNFLAKEFEIKDLGTLQYFLGMEFARSKEGIFVSQRKYTIDLLIEIGLLGCKLAKIPIDST